MTEETLNLSTWMENLDENLRNIPICYLAIPGTHDSLTYSIKSTNSISPDITTLPKILYRLFGPVMKSYIYNWVVTQTVDVTQQLQIGVRYFDLRIATKLNDENIYVCHGLYGMNILQALNEINIFLNNCKEIVILDFQHIYGFTEEIHENFYSNLKSIFGDKLCPIQKLSSVTLNTMLKNGYQVIVIYRDDFAKTKTDLWNSKTWVTLWPRKNNTESLCKFLNSSLKRRRENVGFVSQCLLSPSDIYMIQHLTSTLKQQCCDRCNEAIVNKWLPFQKAIDRYGVNVIIVDFVNMDFCNFPFNVVMLNYAK